MKITDSDAGGFSQARDDLEARERNLRKIVESSLTAICIHQGGKIVYENPAYHELVGPLPGLFRLTAFEHIHPDDVEAVKAFYGRVADGESADVEFRFFPVDGSGGRLGMKWVFCRGTKILFEGKDALLFNLMDMTSIREMTRLMATHEKMASLGRVAAGLTHDIRNALSGINIYLHALEKSLERSRSREKDKEIIRQIKASSNRIESVVRTVRDFSKPGDLSLQPTKVNECIENAVNTCLSSLSKDGIRIEKNLAADLPQCLMDGPQIQRVLVNLVMNAAEAVSEMESDRKYVEVASYARDDLVVVRVSDKGPGVPLQLRGAIFEPFFSDKRDGSGIGLAISQRIVRDHHGFIYVRESPWGGAEFVIEMPSV